MTTSKMARPRRPSISVRNCREPEGATGVLGLAITPLRYATQGIPQRVFDSPLRFAVLDVASSPWKGLVMTLRSVLATLSTAAVLTACGGGDPTYTSEMESEYMAACVSEATLALTEFDLDANAMND